MIKINHLVIITALLSVSFCCGMDSGGEEKLLQNQGNEWVCPTEVREIQFLPAGGQVLSIVGADQHNKGDWIVYVRNPWAPTLRFTNIENPQTHFDYYIGPKQETEDGCWCTLTCLCNLGRQLCCARDPEYYYTSLRKLDVAGGTLIALDAKKKAWRSPIRIPRAQQGQMLSRCSIPQLDSSEELELSVAVNSKQTSLIVKDAFSNTTQEIEAGTPGDQIRDIALTTDGQCAILKKGRIEWQDLRSYSTYPGIRSAAAEELRGTPQLRALLRLGDALKRAAD